MYLQYSFITCYFLRSLPFKRQTRKLSICRTNAVGGTLLRNTCESGLDEPHVAHQARHVYILHSVLCCRRDCTTFGGCTSTERLFHELKAFLFSCHELLSPSREEPNQVVQRQGPAETETGASGTSMDEAARIRGSASLVRLPRRFPHLPAISACRR